MVLQECRRCLRRRRYLRGSGTVNVPWTDADLKELQERDTRAVLRIVLTGDGKPSGLVILKNGAMSSEVLENIRKGFESWKQSEETAIAFEDDGTIRYEFVTVEQLTAGM